MAGVNKAILVGHVGRDPEIRSLTSGGRVATFSLATSESWRDKATGERKEQTQWHRIVVFNDGLVKLVEQYVKTGSKLYVEGAIKTRKYTDQQNIERWSTEIVLGPFRAEIHLLDRSERAPPPEQDDYGVASSTSAPSASQPRSSEQLDDEIPF